MQEDSLKELPQPSLTEFQLLSLGATLSKCLTGNYFDITAFNNVLRLAGREDVKGTKDYTALSGLHCVEWGKMGTHLARLTRAKCIELVGLPSGLIVDVEASPAQAEHKILKAVRQLLRL